ncbi:hypothetical protein PTW37_06435 [Arthrobacter agilis]|uniref:hypothetical protein n=1 Tax=Arthrobacter agilis TaxID=37921 RepID=UPI002366689B|nr:hypothetical protein [Arthrobacter agilis]WDF34531.1 hypothetical protein PTW37_06435 [Arthrobacter agilis]
MDADQQRGQLATIVLEEGFELWDVWLRYFAIGGSATEEQFVHYAVGEVQLLPLQRDLISIALREMVLELQEARGVPDTRNRPYRLMDHGE